MKANDIVFPDPKTLGENIRDAWHQFQIVAEKACGNAFEDKMKDILEAVFVSGYCAGHNKAMDIIIGQQQAVDSFNEILNNKNNNN